MLRLAVLLSLASAFVVVPPALRQDEPQWVTLFNGKDLSGWTPKIAKHALGENFADTFRVEDGILKVDYSGYEKFDDRFGHLFSNLAYSRYILRLEYRFDGKRMADAPGYVHLNSGVMIHAQPPQSMGMDQGFPCSMEMQFLAQDGDGPRSTANVCTPGTNLERNGKLDRTHVIGSTAPTFRPDEWVTAEVEVRGYDEVIHRINGVEVLRYQHPQLDPKNDRGPATDLLNAGAPLRLAHGHIALQAEGQPVWFRNIRLLPLD
ncbi:MAG: hypothetical protein RL398_1501 [Planctomycetota bacterium]|jgi:hypothetical protein